MKEAYRILPVCAGDVSGIASVLYELGGMVVIHDPSGCNSTYNTHDEIRWYDQESYIFISGLNMRDAILGNDRKFIEDIVEAAEELDPEPCFIAICNSPVPYLNGTDFQGICRIVEERSGIKTFYVPGNGMHDYVRGAGRAFLEYARRMLPAPGQGTGSSAEPSVRQKVVRNIDRQGLGRDSEQPRRLRVCVLGATPLTYGNRRSIPHLRRILEMDGFDVTAVWAMGSTPQEIYRSTDADVNLVISDTGILAARYLKETYGIPFVAGAPVTRKLWAELAKKLMEAAEQPLQRQQDETAFLKRLDAAGRQYNRRSVFILIGEAVLSASLAASAGESAIILCPFPDSRPLLGPEDRFFDGEEELTECISDVRRNHPDTEIGIWADPMYKCVLPADLVFHPLPALACSGRLYRTQFPDYFGWVEGEGMQDNLWRRHGACTI
ncbi:nitrogenase component 1 [Porcincola intestinalis]|uniref:nitrogenase component 1 n=1 Tax=Porcincola intestinalis TaxID=2606632 RepID=UPI0023EFA298|nr:nitrogenase component 1 [Porcincola intestinalis]MCI6767780.1 nitrogenase component 1 [Lachnospiraceae bacterium]MDD7060359.1 nitrogenase component 1 [Porcincola intestinalis]MDY5282379.1 nitrogenase component 1 [Porcincola intestinalis]